MLNRYLASTEPRSAPSNEEAQRINKAAQRRLSHHNNRNFSENNQPEMVSPCLTIILLIHDKTIIDLDFNLDH